MLLVGALTTMTPRAVAAGTSTLSSPTPARAITLSRVAAAITSASTRVALRTISASASATLGEQGGPVGAVDVAHVEVVGEHIDGGRGEFLGDQDDGSHRRLHPARTDTDRRWPTFRDRMAASDSRRQSSHSDRHHTVRQHESFRRPGAESSSRSIGGAGGSPPRPARPAGGS